MSATPEASEPALAELSERLARVADLNAAAAVLSWDQETYMPEGAIEARAAQLTTLARVAHEEFTSDAVGELLEGAAAEVDGLEYESNEASLVRVARRDFDRATKIPADLVARLAHATAVGQQAWRRARADSSFAGFQPHLETIVDLCREKGEALGYAERIYDALLDEFEPGMTAADVETVFDALRARLVAIVSELTREDAVEFPFLSGSFEDESQWSFGVGLMRDFGFDFERGRQDRSAHPFTTSFSVTDVRLTTRIQEDFLPAGLFGTLHECGHGLYEQGVAADLDRTPLAGGASLGMHESQSRLWEILVGRSRPFWEHYYPRLESRFPAQLGGIDVDTFYRAINGVRPSLIRVEADEITYNLHIMLRFELENELLEGRLGVGELPEAWNDRMRQYLGISPEDDAEGVLQDIHWSMGAIGYFPTYTLGNLISAQLYAQARRELPELDAQIAAGEFAELLDWLRHNVHRHGRKFTANELLERIGCGPVSAEEWLRYVREKFGELAGVQLS